MRLGPQGDDHGRVQDFQRAAAADSAAVAASLLGSGESICSSGEEAKESTSF